MILLGFIGALLAFVGAVVGAGPVGVMVMQAGFDAEPRRGSWIGLGSAVGQAPYAGLAFYGASRFVAAHAGFVRTAHALAGALLFAVAGWVARRARAPRPAATTPGRGGRAFFLGLGTTVSNPTPLLTWAMAATVLSASGFAQGEGWVPALWFGVCTLAGAAAAFATLAGVSARLRLLGGEALAIRISYGSALMLVGLGVAAWAQAARG